MERSTEDIFDENMEENIHGSVQETLRYGKMTLPSCFRLLGKHLLLLNPRIRERYRNEAAVVLRSKAECGKPSGLATVTNADSRCATPTAGPKGAVTKDFDCGKQKDKAGNIYTDESGGKTDSYMYPPQSVWKCMDCGEKDPSGNIYTDKSCGLSKRMIWGGGAHRDSDCAKANTKGGFYGDQDCSLDNGSGTWTDNDCGLTDGAGTKYQDNACGLFGGVCMLFH